MQRNDPFKRLFALAFFFAIIGALLKINHIANAGILLTISIIATFVYVGIGIYEVNKSTKISSSEKISWTIGFIFLSFFVGIFYFMNRKKIV